MRSLIFVMLAELGPDLWRKGSVQHGLVNSKIHLAGRVALLRCCIKLDVQKGGGPERSPRTVKTCNYKNYKNNALMSASSKFRSII